MNLPTERPRRNTYYPDYGLPSRWEQGLARELEAVDWPRAPSIVSFKLSHRPAPRRATRQTPRRAHGRVSKVSATSGGDGSPVPGSYATGERRAHHGGAQ